MCLGVLWLIVLSGWWLALAGGLGGCDFGGCLCFAFYAGVGIIQVLAVLV